MTGIGATSAHAVRFALPPGWLRLASTEAELEAAAAAGTVARDAGTGEQFDEALAAVRAWTDQRPDRYHWAFVPEPAAGVVSAVLSLQTLRVRSETFAEYAAAAAADGGDRVLSRTFDLVDLPAGRAVRRWDIVVPPAGDGPSEAALERAVVGLFPAQSRTAYEFSLVTQSLSAFSDIVGYLTAIVATVERDTVRS